jgi:hypothetical protein
MQGLKRAERLTFTDAALNTKLACLAVPKPETVMK